MLKKHYKLLLKCALAIPIILLVDFCGILTHLYELNFETHYYYPLHNANVTASPTLDYKFLQMPAFTRQTDPPRLTIVVKSAIGNLQRRHAIRKTWGYETRFSDVNIRRVFVLGVNPAAALASSKDATATEAKHHGDILRADFVDTYFNNTIKTMMGMRWASEHFNTSDFYLFVDDDYYVSIKNVLRFLGGGRQTPHPDRRPLFAGFVFESAPLRHKFSKWYVSLEEYPFDKWPPYVTAGAFILSRDALLQMYAVGRSLPLFRFDDVYLGMVALKAHIPVHRCDQFHFHRPKYNGPDSYSDVIASHGFSDPIEMERIWNECRSANYA
ncbi:beta-1,3-galactosyltransferase brn [Drosophila grimshawi]|uniref:Hexosyltransferase n=1 Tax=Drosophila grimshawi TaxID=7222 RepID=B4JNG9_DROGR|nr:beta-1,3-galactosyltransferase brn [Drosophila grimshawi]EDV92262.1 GH24143 [Drosophila grimshawi]